MLVGTNLGGNGWVSTRLKRIDNSAAGATEAIKAVGSLLSSVFAQGRLEGSLHEHITGAAALSVVIQGALPENIDTVLAVNGVYHAVNIRGKKPSVTQAKEEDLALPQRFSDEYRKLEATDKTKAIGLIVPADYKTRKNFKEVLTEVHKILLNPKAVAVEPIHQEETPDEPPLELAAEEVASAPAAEVSATDEKQAETPTDTNFFDGLREQFANVMQGRLAMHTRAMLMVGLDAYHVTGRGEDKDKLTPVEVGPGRSRLPDNFSAAHKAAVEQNPGEIVASLLLPDNFKISSCAQKALRVVQEELPNLIAEHKEARFNPNKRHKNVLAATQSPDLTLELDSLFELPGAVVVAHELPHCTYAQMQVGGTFFHVTTRSGAMEFKQIDPKRAKVSEELKENAASAGLLGLAVPETHALMPRFPEAMDLVRENLPQLLAKQLYKTLMPSAYEITRVPQSSVPLQPCVYQGFQPVCAP